MKKIILSLAVLAVVLSGCRHDVKEGGQAHISFEISSEGEFVEPVSVKASDDIVMDVNEFSLSIINKESGQTVLSWPKYSEVPSVVSMDPGSYTVKAVSPGNKDVAWSQPIYEGASDVTITPGAVENISLVCTISNMKVTVRCTEKFLAEMSDYSVTVSSSYGALIYTSEIISNGTSGYFKVAPLALDIKATRKTGGSVNHYIEITSVAAKDHHVFTLDASETGYANLGDGLSIDYTVNNREEDIFIDGLEENPVDDEAAVPEFAGSSIADGAVDVPVSTSSVELTYSSNVQLVSGKNITLNGEVCTASVNGSVVTVTLPALAASASYTLAVPDGAIASSADIQAVANGTSISFTTAAGEDTEPETEYITIVCPGVDSPAQFSQAELGESAPEFVLQANVEKGIESFILNVVSENLKEMVSSVGQQPSVDLASMEGAELVFWGGLFGITDPAAQLKGQTAYSLSVGGFIPVMSMTGGPGEYVMSVEIKDAEGNSKSVIITIIITE